MAGHKAAFPLSEFTKWLNELQSFYDRNKNQTLRVRDLGNQLESWQRQLSEWGAVPSELQSMLKQVNSFFNEMIKLVSVVNRDEENKQFWRYFQNINALINQSRGVVAKLIEQSVANTGRNSEGEHNRQARERAALEKRKQTVLSKAKLPAASIVDDLRSAQDELKAAMLLADEDPSKFNSKYGSRNGYGSFRDVLKKPLDRVLKNLTALHEARFGLVPETSENPSEIQRHVTNALTLLDTDWTALNMGKNAVIVKRLVVAALGKAESLMKLNRFGKSFSSLVLKEAVRMYRQEFNHG